MDIKYTWQDVLNDLPNARITFANNITFSPIHLCVPTQKPWMWQLLSAGNGWFTSRTWYCSRKWGTELVCRKLLRVGVPELYRVRWELLYASMRAPVKERLEMHSSLLTAWSYTPKKTGKRAETSDDGGTNEELDESE